MKATLISISLFCTVFLFGQAPSYIFQNQTLSFEERAKDLVAQMTLEEKVGQMVYVSPAIPRLGIPEYNWWNECLHGVARAGRATVFPQAIGMAAMWDRDAMFRIADAISDEARAKHHDFAKQGKRGIYQGLTFWTPNINIFRDPRWGRGMETYGEDPYLTGELAIPFIKGLQGNDPKYMKLIATAKHFVVHSGPEALRHSFDARPTDRDFQETYIPHFKKTIQQANVYSVMCAYNRFRSNPCCGDLFLEDLLRNKWGFKGYIVSDCWAVKDFYAKGAHEVVSTKAEAAAMAVMAGTDLNCGDSYPSLVEAVKDSLLTEKDLDVSVTRLMLARMKLGMFDDDQQVKWAGIPLSVVGSAKHQSLALEAAHKSMVLLKNANSLLPLSKDIKRIAVLGPNADNVDVLLGNYHGYSDHYVTVLEGIKAKLPNAQVDYALGSRLAEELPAMSVIPAKFLFTDTTQLTQGLKGEYFSNTEMKGQASHVRIDSSMNFKWWGVAPFEDLSADTFSVRWTGVIVPEVTGEYAIGVDGHSAYKVYLNDSLAAQWKSEHHNKLEYAKLYLEAGKACKLRIEYVQDKSDNASAQLLWDVPGRNLKAEALALASQADVVVMCMGLSPLLEGEEMKVKVKGFAEGDRQDILLPDVQTELIKEVQALGKPVVVVLLNGSALAFNWEAENIPAILEAWYPGEAGGNAVADVLFGDYNPSGRLPITFYKSVKDLPAFEDYSMQGRTYRYFNGTPLYEFGYGLSYSDFQYSKLKVAKNSVAGQAVPVSVKVKNKSKIDGDELVQLYLAHPNQQNAPIRSLQGFTRIHLKAGESQWVKFELQPDQLALVDDKGELKVHEGVVSIFVGGKQPDAMALKTKKVIRAKMKVKGEYLCE